MVGDEEERRQFSLNVNRREGIGTGGTLYRYSIK